jgi:hypothetical protein
LKILNTLVDIGKGKRSFLNGFKNPILRSTSYFYVQRREQANRIDVDNKRIMQKILGASPSTYIQTKELAKSFHHNVVEYK